MTLIRIPDLLRDLEILKTTRTTSEEKLREVVLRVVKDAKKAASSYHMIVKKAKKNMGLLVAFDRITEFSRQTYKIPLILKIL